MQNVSGDKAKENALHSADAIARAGSTRALVEAVFAPGNVFADRYHAVVADSPAVARAHAEAMGLLEALP